MRKSLPDLTVGSTYQKLKSASSMRISDSWLSRETFNTPFSPPFIVPAAMKLPRMLHHPSHNQSFKNEIEIVGFNVALEIVEGGDNRSPRLLTNSI